jgi:glycerate 2-kinase
MRVVLAPDSYKGSLTAKKACSAMARGVRAVWPDSTVVQVPMADGGDGTAEALVSATGGCLCRADVIGPLPQTTVSAEFGLLGDQQVGVVEMARASGVVLVPLEKRNPLHTTTFGTGQLMAAAIAKGIKRLIVGIGGSATTDAGAGMAQALGVKFFDRAGKAIAAPLTGGGLANVADLDGAGIVAQLRGCEIQIACDVQNPLLGPHGAAAIYGPQKGASAEDVAVLEENLSHFIDLVERRLGRQVRDIPGAGAAGGLGAGLLAFCQAKLARGIELVMQACDLAGKLRGADLVLTGEGQLDSQTASGKTISGVARLSRAAGVPAIALPGRLAADSNTISELGLQAAYAISPPDMPLQEAMANAELLLAAATEKACRSLVGKFPR